MKYKLTSTISQYKFEVVSEFQQSCHSIEINKNPYFNPNANNIFELATINKLFYTNFVEEYKSCNANRFLWTGIQLENLINELKSYCLTAPKNMHNKIQNIITYYTTLYKKLINET